MIGAPGDRAESQCLAPATRRRVGIARPAYAGRGQDEAAPFATTGKPCLLDPGACPPAGLARGRLSADGASWA